MSSETIIKAALIQQPPMFMNLVESLHQADIFVREAAQNGADLAVFPETWLPGYPVWLDNAPGAAMWGHAGANALFRHLCANALVQGSAHFNALRKLAAREKIHVVMGCHELDGNTLYNTMFFFHSDGETSSFHRKLMPTYNEKLIWGMGDGSSLDVMETPFGNLGGLVCWEHWMPLARAAMHARHEVVHVAQWPSVIELHQMASRHYAFEGRCFVLACGTVLTKAQVMEGFDSLGTGDSQAREMLEGIEGEGDCLLMTGGSTAIGPDAALLTDPVFDQPAVIYADLYPACIRESAITLDTDGHYSRPDVFTLRVNDRPMRNVGFDSGQAG